MYFKLPKEREKMIKIIIKKVERKFQKHFSRNNGYFIIICYYSDEKSPRSVVAWNY